jgi:hypothetical protein
LSLRFVFETPGEGLYLCDGVPQPPVVDAEPQEERIK